MDANFPGVPDAGGFGHIFLHRAPDDTSMRFYIWASAIVDGEIVATDYAPDVGWIEMPSQSGN